MSRFVLFFSVVLFLLGCGGAGSDVSPVQGCKDVADALGAVCNRCPELNKTYQQCYDVIVTAAGGSCNNVVSLRDAASLEGTCIPWMDNMTCAQAGALLDGNGNLAASCLQQFQK